ncbi:hypothetical protein [Mycobacterium avium]|uniref:hypothetical protein n=1 Tax=Mycobacterium avium TaxID=1764 RepID=UPI000CE3F696|nr:hypothetical protein [Mycobacterium avium]
MTIHVVTPNDGEHVFDATGWETTDLDTHQEGGLWVGNGDDGVAEFAKGAWLFVYVTADAHAKPRQWKSLFDVPSDVKAVKDCGGNKWTRADTPPTWGDPHHWLNDYAPFTEVRDK